MGCRQSTNMVDEVNQFDACDKLALQASQSSLRLSAPGRRRSSFQGKNRCSRSHSSRSFSGVNNTGRRDVFSIFGERGMTIEKPDRAVIKCLLSPTRPASDVSVSHISENEENFEQSQDSINSNTHSIVSQSSSVYPGDSSSRTGSDIGGLDLKPYSFPNLVSTRSQEFEQCAVRFGMSSNKGMRKAMEDRHVAKFRGDIAYFGVYDGHNGHQVAEYVAKRLHLSVFQHLDVIPNREYADLNMSCSTAHTSAASSSLIAHESNVCQEEQMRKAIHSAIATVDDEIYRQHIVSGCTVISAVVHNNLATVASLGDSRAILSRGGEAVDLCVAHTPQLECEKKRILAAHGTVLKGRIYGVLGVSRSLGDNDFKTSRGEYQEKFKGDLVSSVPDIVSFHINEEDQFLVLGCDGLFEVMSPQRVIDYVSRRLARHGNIQQASEELVEYAINNGSMDNVTAIVVCFHQSFELNEDSTQIETVESELEDALTIKLINEYKQTKDKSSKKIQ